MNFFILLAAFLGDKSWGCFWNTFSMFLLKFFGSIFVLLFPFFLYWELNIHFMPLAGRFNYQLIAVLVL